MASWRLRALALSVATGVTGGVSWFVLEVPEKPANPLLLLERDARAVPLHGRVEQRLGAGGYSYLALRSDDHALAWAVTLGAGAPVGARVSVRSFGRAAHFHSKRLRRTFDGLTFGIVSRDEPRDATVRQRTGARTTRATSASRAARP